MPTVKLMIFDLDGTLIDSLPDLTDATNHMRRSFGLPDLGPEEVRKLVGQGARSLVARALTGSTPEQVEQGLGIFLDYNLKHIADKTRPYSGVGETLEALKAQEIPLCVLSNKNVALCKEVLVKLGLAHYFQDIFGADSFPYRKPSPEPVLAILKGYGGLSGAECALVGDSINDMAAGEGAGVITVGCSYGYGDRTELNDAQYVVPDFPSLLGLSILK